LLVVQGKEHPLLYANMLIASQVHWIAGKAPSHSFDCHAKTRYRQPDQACHVNINPQGQLVVKFKTAQRAITPGQSIVFYRGEECLGGAVIEQAGNE